MSILASSDGQYVSESDEHAALTESIESSCMVVVLV